MFILYTDYLQQVFADGQITSIFTSKGRGHRQTTYTNSAQLNE